MSIVTFSLQQPINTMKMDNTPTQQPFTKQFVLLQTTSDKTEWLNGQQLEFHIFTMNLYAQPHCLSLAILLLIQILERYFWDPGFHYITLLTGNRDLPRSTNRMCIFFCVCLPGIYEIIATINKVRIKIRMFIMHRRLENSLLTTQNSPANIQ